MPSGRTPQQDMIYKAEKRGIGQSGGRLRSVRLMGGRFVAVFEFLAEFDQFLFEGK
jgi:hypothetical protein